MYEGKTYKIYLGMTPFVMLHTPEAVQAIEKRALAVKQQLADQDNISKTGGDGKPFPHSVDIFLKKHFNDPSYTIQDVLEDTLASTFGAADTSTASISLTLYLLGLHPDKQAKLQKELDDAFGTGVSRDYTSEDLEKLPYLDACFKAGPFFH
ncbi:hypothetical protein HPB48_024001 [Haemaphysalis longicornis]|uniref:Cytochrome P450 n=1 Tax=Haemaphysalis longicornis TaxID=44386 RepID=A0A9J6GXH5_HAELO|nr:hypothetical protein HPB48_024001 [Haemaphysalis longicornis]